MGAQIEGIGTSELTVHGVERLHGATYRVMSDRIEAGSYAIAAAITGGDVTLKGANFEEMEATVQALREAMNLPLTLEIAGGAGLREQVSRALEGLAIESIEESGSMLHIRLSRDAKMPALTRLATLGDTLRDLHVREPSLEDVFFGYRN